MLVKSPQQNKKLSAIERVLLARHKDRPHGVDVLKAVTSSFEELHGDRASMDDRAIVCGLAEIQERKCVCIAQEKGRDTEEKISCNFGMVSPAGYRKALRVMQLAERFHLPVITIVDTPGANPSLESEKKGQSRAIAENLFEMSVLETPIVSVVIGEGCSGGALGIGVCDYMVMLENAYFSVISPEGCASILWKDKNKRDIAAKHLKLQAEDLAKCKMVDAVIEEEEGFHVNESKVFSLLQTKLVETLDSLSQVSSNELISRRFKKYRLF